MAYTGEEGHKFGMKDIEDRFWRKVSIPSNVLTDCWEWTGGKDSWGYGVFSMHGRSVGAHRVSVVMTSGCVSLELSVLHACDNPGCVNPYHLFLGTQADNMADRNAKKRQASGDRNGMRKHPDVVRRGEHHWSALHPEWIVRGERVGSSKLRAADIPEIRSAWEGGETQRSIASRYGVKPKTIWRVLSGRSWVNSVL